MRLLIFAAIIVRNAERWQKPRRSEGGKKAQDSAFFSAKAKPATGSRGVPGRTPCKPHRGARYSALYRPDNRPSKSPARHVGPGFLAGGKVQPHEWTSRRGAAAVSVWRGEYVKLTITTRFTTERKY